MAILLSILAFSALIGYALYVGLRQMHRHTRPKDYAFRVYASPRQGSALTSVEKLSAELPWVAAPELASWIADFDALEKAIDRLVQRGGVERIGRRAARAELRRHSPFLCCEGLRRAMALSDYVARGARRA
jgi:hypothetical protein